MPTHKRTTTVVSDRLEISEVTTVTPDTEVKVELVVPSSASDSPYSLFVESTNLKSFVMVATENLTVDTNDGTTPDETFYLTANEPYVWLYGDGTAPIGGDVDTIYLTNSSGSDATFQLLAGWTYS